jgi:predicted ABC-type ATPase
MDAPLPPTKPILYVVAGANGVGKTTIFDQLIPRDTNYVNADSISKQIREKNKHLSNVQEIANQEALDVFNKYVSSKQSFALETNLKDIETYKSFIEVQEKGYTLNVYFLGVDSADVCIDRIERRVQEGGHFVRPDIVKERYFAGLKLLEHYVATPDQLYLLVVRHTKKTER